MRENNYILLNLKFVCLSFAILNREIYVDEEIQNK